MAVAVLTTLALLLGACSSTLSEIDQAEKGTDHAQALDQSEDQPVLSQVSEIRWATTAKASDAMTVSASAIRADMNYKTDTIEGIASVADTIVIGRFIQVKSSVEDSSGYKSVITRGILVPSEVLVGDKKEQYDVAMGGGTVPYHEIANLYTAEELAKYEIDPNTDKYETFSQTFENMTVFEEGKDYLVTLSLSENGLYDLSPSLYSLCDLSEMKVTSNAPSSGESPTWVSFSIDAYVTAFKQAQLAKN